MVGTWFADLAARMDGFARRLRRVGIAVLAIVGVLAFVVLGGDGDANSDTSTPGDEHLPLEAPTLPGP